MPKFFWITISARVYQTQRLLTVHGKIQTHFFTCSLCKSCYCTVVPKLNVTLQWVIRAKQFNVVRLLAQTALTSHQVPPHMSLVIALVSFWEKSPLCMGTSPALGHRHMAVLPIKALTKAPSLPLLLFSPSINATWELHDLIIKKCSLTLALRNGNIILKSFPETAM